MKYPTIRYIYNRRGNAGPETAASIEVLVTHERKRKYIATGVKVLPNQWSDTKHVIRHPDNHSLNMRIHKVYMTVSDYLSGSPRR